MPWVLRAMGTRRGMVSQRAENGQAGNTAGASASGPTAAAAKADGARTQDSSKESPGPKAGLTTDMCRRHAAGLGRRCAS